MRSRQRDVEGKHRLRKQEARRGTSHLGGYELFQFARHLRWIIGLLNEESLGR